MTLRALSTAAIPAALTGYLEEIATRLDSHDLAVRMLSQGQRLVLQLRSPRLPYVPTVDTGQFVNGIDDLWCRWDSLRQAWCRQGREGSFAVGPEGEVFWGVDGDFQPVRRAEADFQVRDALLDPGVEASCMFACGFAPLRTAIGWATAGEVTSIQIEASARGVARIVASTQRRQRRASFDASVSGVAGEATRTWALPPESREALRLVAEVPRDHRGAWVEVHGRAMRVAAGPVSVWLPGVLEVPATPASPAASLGEIEVWPKRLRDTLDSYPRGSLVALRIARGDCRIESLTAPNALIYAIPGYGHGGPCTAVLGREDLYEVARWHSSHGTVKLDLRSDGTLVPSARPEEATLQEMTLRTLEVRAS